jgi:hypothetical protein
MKRVVISVVGGAIIATAIMSATDEQPVKYELVKPEAKHLVNEKAVLSALSETPQFVGLTGDVSKSMTLGDDRWFGDRTYELTLNGEFKLGIDTKDIDITTKGNTVVVKFPNPKVISVDLPFDKAVIKSDIGLLRKDLSDSEVQGLYKEARKAAVKDIKVNIKARDKAETAVKHSLEDLIEQVPYVEDVIFID